MQKAILVTLANHRNQAFSSTNPLQVQTPKPVIGVLHSNEILTARSLYQSSRKKGF
jgi:hypothetical protein